jgi:hypothetical protein
MAMELVQRNGNEAGETSTLLLMSGVALVVFGAGLIVSNPFVRRYMSQFGAGNLLQAAMPDVERYFKLRSM